MELLLCRSEKINFWEIKEIYVCLLKTLKLIS